MVVSRSSDLNYTPRGIVTGMPPTSRSQAGRIAQQLPSLSMESSASSPLRVTVRYHENTTLRRPATRYSRSYTDHLVTSGAAAAATATAEKHVRFELPPAGRPAPLVAGVENWLKSRAAGSSVQHHQSHRSHIGFGTYQASSSSARLYDSGKAKLHDTAKYCRGTLPPTSSSATLGGAGLTCSPLAAAILKAASDGDEELFCDTLKKAGRVGIPETDVNCVDSTGKTPISHIAAHGSLVMLEALLQQPGVDINKPDNEGNTPLHFAAQAGHFEIVNYLLSRTTGIDIDARNNLGFTPLMKAALQGRTKCAKLLLIAGASPTLRDTGRGLRAEQWARFCGRYICAEVIEKYARNRLLDRNTSYGRWGSEPELGTQILLGGKIPTNTQSSSHGFGLKSRLRKAFRTNSSGSSTESSGKNHYSLVTQLTTAALCASSPALPTPNVPPLVKSLIRPLTVPKVHVTMEGGNDALDDVLSSFDGQAQISKKPPGGGTRSKKKK